MKKGWKPSGKWVQRVKPDVHRKLVKLAEREGTTLNKLVADVIDVFLEVTEERTDTAKKEEVT